MTTAFCYTMGFFPETINLQQICNNFQEFEE